MPMAIGARRGIDRHGTQRRTLENGGRDEWSSKEKGEEEEEKEEGTAARWRGRGGRRRTRRAARHCSQPLARDSWLSRPGWPVASITSDTSARSFSPSASPSPPSTNPVPPSTFICGPWLCTNTGEPHVGTSHPICVYEVHFCSKLERLDLLMSQFEESLIFFLSYFPAINYFCNVIVILKILR